MNGQVGYIVAKTIGKLKRDKHKETLNRWFAKQGVELRGGDWMDKYLF